MRFPVRLVRCSLATVAIGALFCSAEAQVPDNPKGTTPSLYERLVGNTQTGHATNNNDFIEFHSPDGRVYGFNWGKPTFNSCWRTIEPDTVCYYYDKGGTTRRESCWRYEAVGDLGFKIESLNNGVTGVVRLEHGNPHDLTDHGKSWTCNPLTSSLPLPFMRASLRRPF